MNKKEIIKEVKGYVKRNLGNEPTGHDWWHSWRVWKLSKKIAQKEGGDLFIIEVSSLLHDVADWKFHGGNTKKGLTKVKSLLEKLGVEQKRINQVCHIIENTSFKGAGVKNKIKTKEGMIVQDADRLDVLGAIGIARVFAYGGFKKREIYNPSIKVKFHKSFNEYKKAKSPSINHFYEKLLLIKDRLNTKTAEKIARERHEFLKDYLKQFFREWRVRL